jgi:hypothetical protein
VSPTGEFVAAGPDSVALVDLRPGQSQAPRGLFSGRSRQICWLGDYDLLCQQSDQPAGPAYEDDCTLLLVNVLTGTRRVLDEHRRSSQGAGGGGLGHYTLGHAGTRTVFWDGTLIAAGPLADYHAGGEGDWSVMLRETEAVRFVRGVPYQQPTPYAGRIVARDLAIVRGIKCGIGRNGPPQILDLNDGTLFDASVTGKESTPCPACRDDGIWWCATAIEGPNVPPGQPRPGLVAIRPYVAKDVIQIDMPAGCVGVDFRIIGNRAVVAAWSATGDATIETDIDLTQERHLLAPIVEPPIVMPPVEVPPVPNYSRLEDPALVGGYFVGSYRWPDSLVESNSAKGVFGNCGCVMGEAIAALTLDPCIDGQLRYRIIDPSEISTVKGIWPLVAGIYISDEGDAAPEQSARLSIAEARMLMDRRGLVHRPMLPYLVTDWDALKRLSDEDPDWLTYPVVQLYIEPGQGADDLRRLADVVLPLFDDRPIVIAAQAYNRNNTFDGRLLSSLVPVYYDIAKRLGPQHKGTLAFSWKRPGGIYDLVKSGVCPDLHEQWKAFARAVPRPVID